MPCNHVWWTAFRRNAVTNVGLTGARSSYGHEARVAWWIGGDKTMRVMVLVKASKDSEAGTMPSIELLQAMGKYNEELVNAGIFLAGEGLQPSSKGKRVAFDGPTRTVVDGPFAETGELVAGFWIWKVNDMAQAVEWVKRCPNPMPGPSEIEIRPAFETADFGDALTPELGEQEERVREKAGRD
jgi:hypothetical protein